MERVNRGSADVTIGPAGSPPGYAFARAHAIMPAVFAFLLRRLLFAVGTIILTAFFAYGMMRALRPEQYPGQATVADLFSDVDRALLHLDFGGACMFAGCPSIKGMWTDGMWVDLLLLVG